MGLGEVGVWGVVRLKEVVGRGQKGRVSSSKDFIGEALDFTIITHIKFLLLTAVCAYQFVFIYV